MTECPLSVLWHIGEIGSQRAGIAIRKHEATFGNDTAILINEYRKQFLSTVVPHIPNSNQQWA